MRTGVDIKGGDLLKTKYFFFIKCIVIFILAFLACAFVAQNSHNNSTTVKAYTEKQKQQAKAWLSAHGYSPTRGGAAQAYADYKSGKLKLSESEKKLAGEKTGISSKNKDKKNQKAKAEKKTKEKGKSKKKPVATSSPTIQARRTETNKTTESVVSPSAQPSTATPSLTSTPTQKDNNDGIDNTLPKESGSDNTIYYVIGGVVVLLIVVLICVAGKKKGND